MLPEHIYQVLSIWACVDRVVVGAEREWFKFWPRSSEFWTRFLPLLHMPWVTSSKFTKPSGQLECLWFSVRLTSLFRHWLLNADGWLRSLYLLSLCAFPSNPETVCSGLCAVQGTDFFPLNACKVLRRTGSPLGPASFTVFIKAGDVASSSVSQLATKTNISSTCWWFPVALLMGVQSEKS